MKGTGGVIVELGGGATGFLRSRQPPAAGRSVLVQVTSWAEPGKAPPVSDRLLLKGRTAILTPGAPGINLARALHDPDRRAALMALAEAGMEGAEPELGLIVRSAASSDGDTLLAEITDLRADWERLRATGSGPAGLVRPAPGARAEALRDWVQPGDALREGPTALAEAGIWEIAGELRRPPVALAAGSMTIEPTRALVAVDVNTGADVSPAAALKANLAAARELPRQLRLRGLGGQVAVDFAPLAKPDRP
jgi:Ribonuclease G/E